MSDFWDEDEIQARIIRLTQVTIDRTRGQVSTHSPNCHQYHVACLAVAVRAAVGIDE